MGRIAVAVSGGADSLYALISLHEQGHKLIALHGLFLPTLLNSPTDGLRELCASRQIPLHILDVRNEFDALVINPFIKSYLDGLTPNPCAWCNKHIKFGLLYEAALKLGAELFATGHYAQSSNDISENCLAKGVDERKDQSYFLALVPKSHLKNTIFPLGNVEKKFIIEYLHKRNIKVPIVKESQEICFVPQDAYRPFLQDEAIARGMELPKQGPIVLKGQASVLGKHKGLWQYTEGQRRGLGIAWKEPLYVCSKVQSSNTLVLATASELELRSCVVSEVNYFVEPKHWPQDIYVRVRYRQSPACARVSFVGDNVRIDFQNSQNPTACGQVAALYNDSGQVLAGGTIKEIY